MSATVYAYVSTFTWNSNTWNATAGGPIRVEVSKNPGAFIEEGTGADFWPTSVYATEGKLRVRVTLRDIGGNYVQALNTVSNATAVILNKQGGTPITMHFANMVLIGAPDPASQSRNQAGDITFIFAPQSADGTTDPVT
jgi:hypothetical protein